MEAQVRYAGPAPGGPPRAVITLDSPARRNALGARLRADLVAALDRVADDADAGRVRVVVLAAAGPAFCSGADLAEAREHGMAEGARDVVALQRRLLELPVPVVARVHGAVRAGGIGLVAASDVVVAAQESSFAFTEVRLGLAASAIGLTVLARMGDRAAAEALLTGRVLDGSAACDAGLVTRCVPGAGLDAEVDAVCADLERGLPQGLAATKAMLTRDLRRRLARDGDAMAAASAELFASPVAREAMAAFLRRS